MSGKIDVAAAAPGPYEVLDTNVAMPSVGKSGWGWGFADKSHRVALLRIENMVEFREAYESSARERVQ
jgi:hypothetical protein